jgi:hypothetical protein
MDRCLAYYVHTGVLAEDTARERAVSPEEFDHTLSSFRIGKGVAIPNIVQPGQGAMRGSTSPGAPASIARPLTAGPISMAPDAATAVPIPAPAPMPAPMPPSTEEGSVASPAPAPMPAPMPPSTEEGRVASPAPAPMPAPMPPSTEEGRVASPAPAPMPAPMPPSTEEGRVAPPAPVPMPPPDAAGIESEDLQEFFVSTSDADADSPQPPTFS